MYISHIKLQHTDGDVLMQLNEMHGPRDVGGVILWCGGYRSHTPGTRGCPRDSLRRIRIEFLPFTTAVHRPLDGHLADAQTTDGNMV